MWGKNFFDCWWIFKFKPLTTPKWFRYLIHHQKKFLTNIIIHHIFKSKTKKKSPFYEFFPKQMFAIQNALGHQQADGQLAWRLPKDTQVGAAVFLTKLDYFWCSPCSKNKDAFLMYIQEKCHFNLESIFRIIFGNLIRFFWSHKKMKNLKLKKWNCKWDLNPESLV